MHKNLPNLRAHRSPCAIFLLVTWRKNWSEFDKEFFGSGANSVAVGIRDLLKAAKPAPLCRC